MCRHSDQQCQNVRQRANERTAHGGTNVDNTGVNFKERAEGRIRGHRVGKALWARGKYKYWATRSSVRSFARTAHSFACSGQLASLAPSAALTRSLAHLAHSLTRGKVND